MKINFEKLLRTTALVGLACIGGWWLLGRVPAKPVGLWDESPLATNVVTDSMDERKQGSSLMKSKWSAANEPATALPPEDLDEAREWTRQNQSAALEWLLTASASDQRDAVAEIVCANIAQYDPAQAVLLAERFSARFGDLLPNLLQQWADQDEPGAYAFAIDRPAGDERDRLLSRVAFARSKVNPAEAADIVAAQIAPGEIQNEAALSVLHQWALRDPNAAQLWARLFPDEGLRARALAEVKNVSQAPPGNISGAQPSL